MGFIEDLRIERVGRDAEVLRRHEEMLARNRRMEAMDAELSRQRELRTQALQNSVVPELAREVGKIAGKNVVEFGGDMSIILSPGRRDETSLEVSIEGREDGSVRIGRTILSPKDARDPAKVEKALGKAYRSPEKQVLYSPYGTPEGCGS